MSYFELQDYSLVLEESGEVRQIEGNIVLQNNITQEFFSAPFESVAEFYNLRKETEQYADKENENRTGIFVWSDEQTRFLLTLYDDKFKQVGPLKKYKTKKHMWSHIGEVCSEHFTTVVTADQVEGRFKTIVKKTKAVIKNNQTSGAVRKEIPFADIMKNIIQNDDSLFPEVFMGPNKAFRKTSILPTEPSTSYSPGQSSSMSPLLPPNRSTEVEVYSPSEDSDANTTTSTQSFTPRKKQKCLAEKLVDKLIQDKADRHVEKEEAKERRHREKMQLLQRFGGQME